ncbi:MAG: 5-(carboxyamino)imidazole ribonucleotide synthase [Gemmataceae bacterium]
MKIGVLGGGQLGRMLALAGYPLGLRFRFLDPAPEAPVEELAELVVGRFDDLDVLARFPAGLDVISYEFENVPVEAVQHLGRHAPVYPPAQALEVSQDRLAEKTLFQKLGIPPAPFAIADSLESLEAAVAQVGLPAVLKTRRLGYDGKGQAMIRQPSDVQEAWRTLGGVPLILEGFIAFDREVSQIGVRGRDGAIALYPLVENHHEGGILRLTLAPAPHVPESVQGLAARAMRQVLEHLNYVGVLAIEFFLRGDELLANEMAPRVHNSGHWSIEGARTSQFENHLRAVLGWPLGSTEAVGHSAMVNLIGTIPTVSEVLAIPGTHLHLYGKAPRPGRKLGHATIWAETPEEVQQRLRLLQTLMRR